MTPVRIRSVTGCGPRFMLTTPEYTSNMSRGKAEPGRWAVVTVEFDTQPEWVDEIVFQYNVVTHNRRNQKEPYTLLKGSVAYIDVPKERRNISTIYLRPSTVKRYGEVVGISVEILIKGEVVDSKAEAVDPNLRGEWWKTPRLIPRDGYLVNKSETPFAFINFDDEATIKK